MERDNSHKTINIMGIYQRKQKLETNDDAGKCYLSDSIHFMKQYMAELTFTYTIPVYE